VWQHIPVIPTHRKLNQEYLKASLKPCPKTKQEEEKRKKKEPLSG
jgi:hypothetical protein